MFFNYSNIIDPLLKSVRAKIAEEALVKKDSVVLDVCCGTGDQAFYYAKISDYVFGIDLDPKMIALAEERKRKENSNVFFEVGDASKLPFENDYFDIVSICLALHEKNEELRNKVLAEIKRVTKLNGEIIIVDYSAPLPNNPTAWLVSGIEWLAGKDHFSCFRDYLKKGGLKYLLRQSGLKVEKNILISNRTMEITKIHNF